MSSPSKSNPTSVATAKMILEMREHVEKVYVDERIKEYILRLVMATRPGNELTASEMKPDALREIQEGLQIGASPRATIFLSRAAKAYALLEQRSYVTPDDIKAVAPEILRHRLILSFEAEAKRIDTDSLVSLLLQSVTVP